MKSATIYLADGTCRDLQVSDWVTSKGLASTLSGWLVMPGPDEETINVGCIVSVCVRGGIPS